MATESKKVLNSSYHQPLTRDTLLENPFMQLELWVQEAVRSGMQYPTSMTLATLGADGQLDQRTVLLRHCDAKGLIFFAGDDSKKIHDLRTYPSVSAHFFWHELDRQVRVRGIAKKVSAAETTYYFVTPPDFSKQPDLSKQSNHSKQPDFVKPPAQCISLGAEPTARQFLIEQFNMMRSKFYGADPRDKSRWSGYRIVPDQFEFWQGGGPRLRDRFHYQRIASNRWLIDPVEE